MASKKRRNGGESIEIKNAPSPKRVKQEEKVADIDPCQNNANASSSSNPKPLLSFDDMFDDTMNEICAATKAVEDDVEPKSIAIDRLKKAQKAMIDFYERELDKRDDILKKTQPYVAMYKLWYNTKIKLSKRLSYLADYASLNNREKGMANAYNRIVSDEWFNEFIELDKPFRK